MAVVEPTSRLSQTHMFDHQNVLVIPTKDGGTSYEGGRMFSIQKQLKHDLMSLRSSIHIYIHMKFDQVFT